VVHVHRASASHSTLSIIRTVGCTQPSCQYGVCSLSQQPSLAATRNAPLAVLTRDYVMGNLCGKESSDPFAGPGRQLGSSSPPASSGRATLPSSKKPKITGPGRTLSENTHAAGGGGDDARRQAAQAAEVCQVPQAQEAPLLNMRIGTRAKGEASKGQTGGAAGTAEATDKDRHFRINDCRGAEKARSG
jgi:hypothetical protein